MTANFPVGGPVLPSFGPAYPSPKASRAGVWLGAIACVLASAALVVGVIGLATDDPVSPQASSGPENKSPEPMGVFDDGADRELCSAMGPLMRESIDRANALQTQTQQNTLERKAAIPKYVEETYDWSNRMQALLNDGAGPPRFLTQNLQDFIYHNLLFAEQLSPERDASVYENQIYEYTLKDLAGLIGRCSEVGVRWWKTR